MRKYLTNKVISAIKPSVPTTKLGKAKSELAKAIQKTKGSKAKLKQTLFEIENKMPLTFKTKPGKSESNTERYKRIQKENSKVIKGMIDKAVEKKADGGRIGRRLGGGADMAKKKTNVEKIKETFSPKKKNLSPKQMKIAKLAGNPNKIDGADFKKLRNR